MDGQFYFCKRCETVFSREAWIFKGWKCPSEGCEGGAMDPWDWSRFVRSYDYPEQPAPGSSWSPIGLGPKEPPRGG